MDPLQDFQGEVSQEKMAMNTCYPNNPGINHVEKIPDNLNNFIIEKQGICGIFCFNNIYISVFP